MRPTKETITITDSLTLTNKTNNKMTDQLTTERKLATIQEIESTKPIEGADLIELATVKGWNVVVKKGEFKKGDKVVYCEIDSFLPIKEQFEFLRKSSFKKMGDLEGFRLKTIKLRGQISQGLILPVSVLPDMPLLVGENVSDALGITKFEPPIPAQLAGKVKGMFPSFIFKTDEERIQNLTDAYENYKRNSFYLTEKLDGSSATFYYNNGSFGVCSRNLDLLETEDNSFWKVARLMDLEELLKPIGNMCLQGELIGEGIQGNPYQIKGQRVYFFNAFDIDKQAYLDFNSFIALADYMRISTVPILDKDFTLPNTVDELLKFAEGNSVLNDKTIREGIVVRSHDRRISFKAISNHFLLKENN